MSAWALFFGVDGIQYESILIVKHIIDLKRTKNKIKEKSGTKTRRPRIVVGRAFIMWCELGLSVLVCVCG
jgi:hypothetical protein